MYMNKLKEIWDETDLTYAVIAHVFKHRIIWLHSEEHNSKGSYHVVNENGMRVKHTSTIAEAFVYLKEKYNI